MFSNNIKLSLHAIKMAKWRSLLTMLGIIIGVVSVITTVSLGQGVKSQVSKQVNYLGRDIITIRPGKVVTRDNNGTVTGINFISSINTSNLTANDLQTIQNTSGVSEVVPLSVVNGTPHYDGRQFNQGVTLATNEFLPDLLKRKVEFGAFWSTNDDGKNIAVIGANVAHQLFNENVPIGKSFTFRQQDFIVRGVFESSDSPLVPGVDFNSAIFIPEQTGKTLTNDGVQFFQIFVKPSDPKNVAGVMNSLRQNLKNAHGGEEDFSILSQPETLMATGTILNLLTGLVAGVAAISLFVGGIGIANIMLVSVSERIHEIGIKKAIGATNRQILREFLTEAIVLCFIGGLIGTFVAAILNILIRLFTNLQPVITWQVVVIANGVSLTVGIVFGVVPAFKAAHKDPIRALRNE